MDGKTLRQMRIDCGISQAEFAQRVGYTKQAISLMELDERTVSPDVERCITMLADHAIYMEVVKMQDLEVQKLQDLTNRSGLMASISDVVGRIPVDSMCAVTVRLWLTLTLQSITCFVKARKPVVDYLVAERGLCGDNTWDYDKCNDLICQMQDNKSSWIEHFTGSWHEVSTIIGSLLRSDSVACHISMRDRLVLFYNNQITGQWKGVERVDITQVIAQGQDDILYSSDAASYARQLLSLLPSTDSDTVNAYKSALYCLEMQLLQ